MSTCPHCGQPEEVVGHSRVGDDLIRCGCTLTVEGTDYREVARELDQMYARPWWHWDRWVLRWWHLERRLGRGPA